MNIVLLPQPLCLIGL